MPVKDITDYAGFTNTFGGNWTAAMQAMANDAHGNSSGVGGDYGHVVLPPGKGVWSGSPFSLGDVAIKGQDSWHTMLTCTTPLVNTSGIGILRLKDMALFGVTDPIQIGTATDVGGRMRIIHDVEFHGYSGTAIKITGSDTPYFDIQRCTFDGAANSTAISMAGLTDSTVIAHNEFRSYKIGIKLGGGMGRTTIENNNFMHVSETSSAPRYDIWIVPSTSPISNNGLGVNITNNWHGSEGRATNDWFIVLADATSGLPNLTAASTGYVYGMVVDRATALYTSAAQPFIFSTTDRMKFNAFGRSCRQYVPFEAVSAAKMLQTLSGNQADDTNSVVDFMGYYHHLGVGDVSIDPLRTDYIDGEDPNNPQMKVTADDMNAISGAINTLAGG